MPCKECGASDGLYHYTGLPPYDGKFFQETYQCQECGYTEDTKVVPFFRELVYQDIPASAESGLTKRAADGWESCANCKPDKLCSEHNIWSEFPPAANANRWALACKYKSLMFEKYPLPWSIENISPDWNGAGGYIIKASDGTLVIHGGTYTGDGDLECNFTYLQAKELVDIVNAQPRVQRTAETPYKIPFICLHCGESNEVEIV